MQTFQEPLYAVAFKKKDGKVYVAKDWHPADGTRAAMLQAAESGLLVVGFVKKRAFIYKDLGISLQALDLLIDEPASSS